MSCLFSLMALPLPTSPLFPYTTLFRSTPGGAAVAKFSLATTEVWTDKSGQRQERTEWHNIDLWGKQDRKSTRLNSSHSQISYAVFCLKKKKKQQSTALR